MTSNNHEKLIAMVSNIMSRYDKKLFIEYGVVNVDTNTDFVVYFIPIRASFVKFFEHFDDEENHDDLYDLIDDIYGDRYKIIKNQSKYIKNHGHTESITIYIHQWK